MQPALELPAPAEPAEIETTAALRPSPTPRTRTDGADDTVAAAATVRPYVLTKGRTRARHDFALEALVSSSQDPATLSRVEGEEHRAVLVLCVRPRSVVEVAAMLSVPLGVARVLLSDLADIGAVTVHQTVGPGGPDQALMTRVLDGLRRL